MLFTLLFMGTDCVLSWELLGLLSIFGPLRDNQWGGCRLDPKKSRREIFQRIFALGIFWGGVNRYAATTLIVALSPGHSATGNHLDRAEKIPNLLRRLAPLTFLIRVQAFWDPLGGEFPHDKIFMMDPTRSREMPSCSAIDLAEIRRSSKISSWI